jgi:transposase
MGRRKVAIFRALAEHHGWLAATAPLPEDAQIAAALKQPKRASSTVSSAEGHRIAVARWVAEGVNGAAIHAALVREHGYTGSYSSVHRLIVAMRADQGPQDATVRLTFGPAEAAQVDFGAGPMLVDAAGVQRRTWAFVMTLAFSRHQYLEFIWDQSVATWLGCHRRAFEWFGAVPARVIIDNPKCAITKACSRDPVVQRAYAECAEGYGFKIDPCPPADPQKKGIVESGVKYVKGNFLSTRTFRDMTDLNTQAKTWVMEQAGRRLHGTTREPPLERFERERPLMHVLPAVAPDLGVWTKVRLHRDCHVQFQRSLYSAPFTLIGRLLWLRATDTTVSLFQNYQLVAQHLRAHAVGTRRTVREHLPPEAQAFFMRDRHWCVQQANAIGPACAELIQALLADHIVERLRAAQGVIHLAQAHPAQMVDRACRRALDHNSPHYRTVKTLLTVRPYLLSQDSTDLSADHYVQAARFARPASSLFLFPDAPHIHITSEGDRP